MKKIKPSETPPLDRWRVLDVEPQFAWAELSEDIPPVIWDVAYYRENLRSDLRHIQVKIVPVSTRAAPRLVTKK